ncbi:cholecystokinin receptor-like [Amyelois transitella]|uniref:cholecystokinin receptor-like n=1 Tax=Amyelois transitella TaxID=680683 RepID=UPI00298F692A|nr:cholecystokinin receptor-like [Amyelois transitella]
MEDPNSTSIANSSLLRMRDVTTTDVAVVTIKNATAVSNAYEWRFILPPYILIFLLSISGNCLVIATLTSNRRMRTVTNVYLLNLLAVSVSVDVWTLVAISLERYFAICRPLKSRKWQTQCHAYKMIAVVWVLSVTLNWPILIVSKLQPMRGNAYKCREVWSSLELERAFNLGLDVALLLVPFFIMSFAYCLIVTKLWRGMRHEIKHNFNWQRHLANQSSMKNSRLLSSTPILDSNSSDVCCNWNNKKENQVTEDKQAQSFCMHSVDLEFRHVVRSTHIDKSIEAKRKVIRMLFVIILEFFVCWTPLHVINTIYLFYPEELYHYVGSKGIVCLQLLAYCASCCNPITYCFMNRKFRQAFITLLKTCRLFRGCFPEKLECKQATPPPSSQDVTACIVRGSQTGRTDLEALEGEDCV